MRSSYLSLSLLTFVRDTLAAQHHHPGSNHHDHLAPSNLFHNNDGGIKLCNAADNGRFQPSQKPDDFVSDSDPSEFVTLDGNGGLELDGKPFRFISLAAPNLFKTDTFGVDDTFRTFAALGHPVTRPYTFAIKSVNVWNEIAHVLSWNKGSNLWDLNEAMFKKTDYVLDSARKHGVKLIIPIINQNYASNESSNWNGNWADLIRLRYGFSNFNETLQVDFWTDPTMIDAFKILVGQILNRQNTVNGIRYGDDSTVLAWETGNEMEELFRKNVTGGVPPGTWTVAVCEHIKSLSPNTLTMDGTYSRNGSLTSQWAPEALASKAVDIFSNHYYGDGDRARTKPDTQFVKKYQKAFVAGEAGFFSAGTKYPEFFDWVRTNGSDGTMIWSLREHSSKGGFVVHGEGNNIYSYHAPGWTPPRDTQNFDKQEKDVIQATYTNSWRISAESSHFPAYPVPNSPVILSFNTTANTTGLIWQGSTWGKDYQLARLNVASAVSKPNSRHGSRALKNSACYNVVADNLLDNLSAGSVLYTFTEADNQACGGSCAHGQFVLRSFSVGGIPGPWSPPFTA